MNKRVARTLLAVGVGSALLVGGVVVTSNAFADEVPAAGRAPQSILAPAHSGFTAAPAHNLKAPAPAKRLTARANLESDFNYAVNTQAAWVGQTVTLNQLTVPAGTVSQVVNWGDGSAPVTLAAGQTSATKAYTAVGDYTVSVSLTGTDGTVTPATVEQNGAVNISVPATVTLNETAVWLGQSFRLTVDGVQQGFTTQLSINWGDGYSLGPIADPDSGYADWYYYHRAAGSKVSGTVHPAVTFTNKLGSVTVKAAINIRPDLWRPLVAITHPANASAASSWKQVAGSTSDQGSGTAVVWVLTTKTVGKKAYCWDGAKKGWLLVKSFNTCSYYAQGVLKGKWLMRLSGVAKGSTLTTYAIATDWADTDSKTASYRVAITK